MTTAISIRLRTTPSQCTIDVTDVNEAPEFLSTETGARTVAENTRAGQTIGDRFEATDPDGDHNLTYTLGGDDAASFNIDEYSGWLRTKDDLDYETKDQLLRHRVGARQ